MSLTAKLHLKNDSHPPNSPLQQVRAAAELFDLALVCRAGKVVEAHKLVLSAYSPVFRGMLNLYHTNQALVFLPDTDSEQMESLLDFLYTGETSVDHQQFGSFLSLAKKLEISELCNEEIRKLQPVQQKPFMAKINDVKYENKKFHCQECGNTFTSNYRLKKHECSKSDPSRPSIDLKSKETEADLKKEIYTSPSKVEFSPNSEEVAVAELSDDNVDAPQTDNVPETISKNDLIDFHPDKVLRSTNSHCWKFLLFKGTAESGPDKSRVFCKLCGKSWQRNKAGGSTTVYNFHLVNVHRDQYNEVIPEAEFVNVAAPRKVVQYNGETRLTKLLDTTLELLSGHPARYKVSLHIIELLNIVVSHSVSAL